MPADVSVTGLRPVRTSAFVPFREALKRNEQEGQANGLFLGLMLEDPGCHLQFEDINNCLGARFTFDPHLEYRRTCRRRR